LNDFHPAKRLRGIEKSLIRQVFDRAQPGSINLGLGEPDLPTPGVIRRAAIEVIDREQNGYTTHAGLPALRELVSQEYPQLNLKPDQVIITAGSQEALYLAVMTLVDDGDEVLLPNPGFVAYPTLVSMAGGHVNRYLLAAAGDFRFDADEFRRAITPRTKVVVCISPSNPTGQALKRDDLKAIAAALSGTGIIVISDEIYRDLYFTSERPPSISEYYPRTVVISGLSKSMNMTGWRIGWLCGDADIVRSALILHGYVTTCASTVTQKASLRSWTDEARGARQSHRERFGQRRDFFLPLLQSELGLRGVCPDGAFYTMVDVSAHGDSKSVAERMLDERVITVPGVAFGSEGEGYLRISFCAEPEILAEGVRRMERALKSQPAISI